MVRPSCVSTSGTRAFPVHRRCEKERSRLERGKDIEAEVEHDGGMTNKPAASRRVRVSTGLWLPAMCSAECQGAPVNAWPRLKRRVCVQRCQGGVPGDGGQQGAVVCTCGLCGHARRERSTKCPRGLILSRTRRHGCVRVQKVVARLGFNVCVPRGQKRCSLGAFHERVRRAWPWQGHGVATATQVQVYNDGGCGLETAARWAPAEERDGVVLWACYERVHRWRTAHQQHEGAREMGSGGLPGGLGEERGRSRVESW